MPFAGYEDFDDCVRQNSDKDDPEAYCAAIQQEAEGKDDVTKPTVNLKNMVERKNVTLTDQKFDADTGTFSGYASVFNVKDLQNDVVLPGAFRKTISDNSGMFVLLDQHERDREIGLVRAKEDDRGLFVEGEFYVDPQADPAKEIRLARDTYIKMKRRQEAGKPLQFSIGYRAINPRFEKGARLLGEIGLAEVSTVTFPALPAAVTTAVKGEPTFDLKGFMEDYQQALQTRMPVTALDVALDFFWMAAVDAIVSDGGDSAMEQWAQDLNDFTEAVAEAVRMAHGVEDSEEKAAIDAAVRDRLDSSTEGEEPPRHSEPEAADEGKAEFLAHLAQIKRQYEPSGPEILTQAIRERTRQFRAKATGGR